ncbi:MAG: LacI family DNA-binding transcriptional regulator [Kluyvera sp.]
MKEENKNPEEYKEPSTSRITIKSLAKEMGISHTTISNVWNNPEKLSVELRERILRYAEKSAFRGRISSPEPCVPASPTLLA